MMAFEQFYPELESIIEGLAFEFGGKGRHYGADNSDFKQEFIVWLLEHEEKVQGWIEEHEPEGVVKLVARSLRNEGSDYLLDIKAQATGYERHDLYFYTRNEIKELLSSVYDQEKWHEPPQSEGRSTKAPAEGGNWIATLADVSRALDSLNNEDRTILEGIHRDSWTNKMMAEEAGISESLMSYRHNRALNRLSKALGGERPQPMREQHGRDPWRGRHACTNAAAQAYQSNVYERGEG